MTDPDPQALVRQMREDLKAIRRMAKEHEAAMEARFASIHRKIEAQ